MSEKSLELVSTLADDELDSGSEFIINAMTDDQELRNSWCHYHLIGEALRGNLPEKIDMTLADRISKVIASDPPLSLSSLNKHQFLKPAAGFAIAASVALVAILGVRQVGMVPGNSPTPVIAESSIENSNAHITTVAAESAGNTPPREYTFPVDAETRLNRYLVNHNEYRANVSVQGMLPYVRIVAHEVEE